MTLHIGFTGGGNITQTHARAAQDVAGVKVAAFFGSNAEKTTKLANDFHAVAYADFDSFLQHRPMDLVCIGSPSGLHAQQGIAAAERGLHVLVEKPLDISLERADALIAEAEKAGVRLGVFFQDRFKPGPRELKRVIDTDGLGPLIIADGRVKWFRPPAYYAESRWRGTFALDGGGALINQGIHTVDLLLWLAGDIRAAQARMNSALHRIEAEDTLVALLEFKNGAIGTFEVTTAAFPGYPRRVELSGVKGSAALEGDTLVNIALSDGGAGCTQAETAATIAQSSATVADVSAHRAVLEDFVEAIDQNRRPLCDGLEARRSLAVVDALYRAARSGRTENVTR